MGSREARGVPESETMLTDWANDIQAKCCTARFWLTLAAVVAFLWLVFVAVVFWLVATSEFH